MSSRGVQRTQDDRVHVPPQEALSDAFVDGDATPAASPAAAAVAMASTQHLCALTCGVLLFHVLTSALQEHIFHLPGFSNVLLLSFGETLCTALLVAVQMTWTWSMERRHRRRWEEGNARGRGDHRDRWALEKRTRAASPARQRRACVSSRLTATLADIYYPSTVQLRWYGCIALLMSCSLYLTNRSSLLLSYPMQVIFKSSKLLCMVVVRRWWMAASARKTDSDDSAEDAEREGGGKGRGAGGMSLCATRRASVHTDGGEKEGGDASVPRVAGRSPTSVGEGAHAGCDDGTSCGGRGSLSHSSPAAEEAVRVSMPVPQQPYPDTHKERRASADGGVHHGATSVHRRTNDPAERVYAGVSVRCVRAELSSILVSLRGCRLPHHRLRALRQWLRQRCAALMVALRTAPAVVGRTVCTQRGCTGLLRAVAPHLRAFLHDGELHACMAIVLGLILFTYASGVEERVATPNTLAAPAAAGVSGGVADALPGVAAGLSAIPSTQVKDLTTSLPLSTIAAAAAVATGAVERVVTFLSDWYTVSLIGVVGVAGVLLSNLLDTVIYMLEEIYCFQTAGKAAAAASTTCVAEPPGREDGVSLRGGERGHPTRTAPSPSVAQTSSHGDDAAARKAHHPTSSACLLAPVVVTEEAGKVEWLADGDVDVVRTPAGAKLAVTLSASLPDPWPKESELEERDAAAAAASPEVAVAVPLVPSLPSPRSPAPPQSIPATSQEVLLILNSIATLLYGAGLLLPWLLSSGDAATLFSSLRPSVDAVAADTAHHPFPLTTFVVLIVLASFTSLVGTLCLLSIVATYTSVMAVIVTSLRKTLTILLSYVLYGRPFTPVHAVGLAGVMGGVVWHELLRRQQTHH